MPDRRQEILDAALALADEKGLDAVSMRAVAERTGVTPMALYPHVGSKAALLDGMLGRLLADLRPTVAATEPADWRQRLRTIAHLARGLAHRHPWAAMLIFSRPSVAPDAVRVVDQIYAALIDAGVPDADVARVERLLSTFVIGYAASETGGRFSTGTLNPRGRRDQLAAGELPAHHALATWLDTPVDWDAEFETDLDDLVRLIEAIASGSARGAAAQVR
ncbi:MAG TPA: TetR/AcrR family transcriptional regulator [Streptosporangiaceae bacterium]|jgi:AcrR family transcriptional regulator